MELAVVILLLEAAGLFPAQLLLCFKARRRLLRRLPLLLLAGLFLLFMGLTASVGLDGDAAGPIFLSLGIFMLIGQLFCALAWLIWGLCALIKKLRA